MTDATKVKDLEFSDLYLGQPELEDRFSDVPGAMINPLPARESLRADLDKLIQSCRDTTERSPAVDEFKMNYDGVIYRVSVLNSLGGKVFVVRKIAGMIPTLVEL